MQDLLNLEDVIPSLPLAIECISAFKVKLKFYKIFVSTKTNFLFLVKRTKKFFLPEMSFLPDGPAQTPWARPPK